MPLILLTDTNPRLLLNANPRRKRLEIQMPSTVVNAGNTGRIHIGLGFQPETNVESTNSGEQLARGSAINEPQLGTLAEKYKQSVWARSTIANQTLVYSEEVEPEAKPVTPAV